MLVKIEFDDGSREIKRHFASVKEAYDFFSRMCAIHETVAVSITERFFYARCKSKELKGLSDAL